MKKEKKKAPPKVCSHCGAKLLKGMRFCGACGRSVVIVEEKTKEEPAQSVEETVPNERPAPEVIEVDPATNIVDGVAVEATQPAPESKPKRKKKKDNYDGYYDDVKPVDAGEFETGKMDREQIKRIVILIGGTLAVIGLAVVMLVAL